MSKPTISDVTYHRRKEFLTFVVTMPSGRTFYYRVDLQDNIGSYAYFARTLGGIVAPKTVETAASNFTIKFLKMVAFIEHHQIKFTGV